MPAGPHSWHTWSPSRGRTTWWLTASLGGGTTLRMGCLAAAAAAAAAPAASAAPAVAVRSAAAAAWRAAQWRMAATPAAAAAALIPTGCCLVQRLRGCRQRRTRRRQPGGQLSRSPCERGPLCARLGGAAAWLLLQLLLLPLAGPALQPCGGRDPDPGARHFNSPPPQCAGASG